MIKNTWSQLTIITLLAATIFSCSPAVVSTSPTRSDSSPAASRIPPIERFLDMIHQQEIETMLHEFASNEFFGREAGSAEERIATEYISDFYKTNKIAAAPGTDDYYQTIPARTYPRMPGEANNVIAYIPGTDMAHEVVVLSAHLDHLGFNEQGIFNGADDNGSGTIAIMQIAKAFKKAELLGVKPRRTMVFLHVTGEEKGLYGSHYYAENPLFPMENTITNLNIDMIGRVDDLRKGKNEDYLYLIGSEMLSKELKEIAVKVNQKHFNMEYDFKYDEPNDPNRFYYRSDHYNFAKNNVPAIFYFNGTHEDYHKVTDTPDKINYPLLTRRTKLIFATAWELVHRDRRPALD
ncbi:MAG: M28 family peptidase [Weeksellaceae bacterium]|nr:M28 family peptidase [Weeksellaceae bacterium]